MKRNGFTMISMLLTVVIICVLMVVMMQGMGGLTGDVHSDRKDGLGKTTMGGARLSAEDQVCRSNLNQVRESLAAARMTSTDGPVSLSDVELPASIKECPIGHEPYQIDAATGEVHCVHPGHEKF